MPTVLLIDDHEHVRHVYRVAFEAEGYDVIEAADGKAGVDAFKESQPDLVVTDIEMPQKDGHSVIREIREASPDARVVALTGAGAHHLPVAHDLGADRIFEKPIRPRDLVAAVEALIS